MVSEKQLIANRENARLGGVKTEAGKAAVRLNAVTHGLLTKVVVVHGKNIAVLNQLRDNMMAESEPQGELETMLVERIATCIWRLRRVLNAESDHLHNEWDRHQSYPFVQSHLYGWENMNRYETMIERQIYKARHELERLQMVRRGQPTLPPLAIDVDLSRQN
jgi:hypothetical protein